MTDFDKKLIEKANQLSRWDYRMVDALIRIADTEEAKERLHIIKLDMYDMVLETL